MINLNINYNNRVEERKENIKRYGPGAFISNYPYLDIIDSYTTGSKSFNRATGINGYPKGSIIEIFGDEGSGKSLLALNTIKENQNIDSFTAAIIDSDHALSLKFIDKMGIDKDKVILQQPKTAEEAFESIIMLLEAEAVNIIILDSIPSLLPKVEKDMSFEEIDNYTQANVINKYMVKISKIIKETNTLLIMINQTRSGMGSGQSRIVGGRLLPFFSSYRIRVDLEDTKILSDHTQYILRAFITKNKYTYINGYAKISISLQKE